MPQPRYYTIEQTRSVKVTANDEEVALALANEAFGIQRSEGKFDGWGHTLGRVEVTHVDITQENI
jgi:hypothetical protein